MRIDRLTAIFITSIALTGCASSTVEEQQTPPTQIEQQLADARQAHERQVREEQEHPPGRTDVEVAVAYMAQAQRATYEEWSRLHQLLASSAAIKRAPHLQAYVAFVLSQGPRSDEELERAQKLMGALLRQSNDNSDQQTPSALSAEMYQLVRVQHDQLQHRLAMRRELAINKRDIARARTKLAIETAAHAKTKRQRDDILVELDGAREQLRAVTRIELKHQSNGG